MDRDGGGADGARTGSDQAAGRPRAGAVLTTRRAAAAPPSAPAPPPSAAPAPAPPPGPVALGHTLGFCRRGDRVLMLRRTNPPFAGRWNGVGGKLAAGEAAEVGMLREIGEETPLRPDDLGPIRRVGAVRWTQHDGDAPSQGGMHVFVVAMRASLHTWEGTEPSSEGELSWLLLREVVDPANPKVVRNIARFLPAMLRRPGLVFHCDYRGEELLAARPLTGREAQAAR